MLNTSHSIEAWTFSTDTVMSKQIIVSYDVCAVTAVVGTLVMSYYKMSISSNLPKLFDG